MPSLEARHAALQTDLVAERSLDKELSAMSAEDIEVRQNMLADSEEQEYVSSVPGASCKVSQICSAQGATCRQP